MALQLHVLPERLAVCRLAPEEALPGWALRGSLWCVMRTVDELSVVCEQIHVPGGVRVEGGWRALKVIGPLDFALTGILAELAGTLAEAGVSIFALSTFDTDYILVKEDSLGPAIDALRGQGYTVHTG